MSVHGALELKPTVPSLSDGTVVLRALAAADAPAVVRNCRDPEAVRWTTVPLDYVLADAHRFIGVTAPEGWTKGTVLTFAVAAAEDNRLLGTIDLQCTKPGTADVGINIGPDHRGSGVAKRAVELLADYAFTQLNLAYLHWVALAGNWGSRKLAWKLGFRLEGELRGFANNRGTPSDAWVLTLAAGDPRVPSEPWQGPTPGNG